MKPMLLVLMSLLVTSAHAGDAVSGQRLFAASRCLECHSAEIFTKPDRKVQNFQQLEQKVRQCDASLSTNWFDDEIQAVVKYLNDTYYKFPAPAATSAITPTTQPQMTASIASDEPVTAPVAEAAATPAPATAQAQ